MVPAVLTGLSSSEALNTLAAAALSHRPRNVHAVLNSFSITNDIFTRVISEAWLPLEVKR